METKTATLDQKIEALLFIKGEPLEISELAKLCSSNLTEVGEGLQLLKSRLAGSALALVQTDDTVALTTKPELFDFLQNILKLEREEPLTKSQLETLSIILYEQPVSAAKVEYVRGVNSRYSLRALMLRGLVERRTDENDARVSLYVPTIQLLQLLGVADTKSLPDYELIKNKLATVEQV